VCPRCRRRRRRIEQLGARPHGRNRARYRGDISRLQDDDEVPELDPSEDEDTLRRRRLLGEKLPPPHGLGYRQPARAHGLTYGEPARARGLTYREPPRHRGLVANPPPKRGLGPTGGWRPEVPAPKPPTKPRGHGLGGAHPRDPMKAHLHYRESISRGIYGEDVWRFSAGAKLEGESPIDR
jgi:hypothetical protein